MLIVGPGIMAQQHIPSRQARCSHYDQQAEHPTPLSTLQQLQPQSTPLQRLQMVQNGTGTKERQPSSRPLVTREIQNLFSHFLICLRPSMDQLHTTQQNNSILHSQVNQVIVTTPPQSTTHASKPNVTSLLSCCPQTLEESPVKHQVLFHHTTQNLK